MSENPNRLSVSESAKFVPEGYLVEGEFALIRCHKPPGI